MAIDRLRQGAHNLDQAWASAGLDSELAQAAAEVLCARR
jgi:hypothetical protein